MESEKSTWNGWANFLKRRGLLDGIIFILQLAGPFTFLASQLIHIGAPLLRLFVPQNQLLALVGILEEPEKTMGFASYLSELRQKDV